MTRNQNELLGPLIDNSFNLFTHRIEKYLITISSVIYALKALAAGPIFFVWVVRYREIIGEFKAYGLPD